MRMAGVALKGSPPTSSTHGNHASIRSIAPANTDRTECTLHTDTGTGKLRNSRDSI